MKKPENIYGNFDYWWNYFKERHLPETEEDYKAIASLVTKRMCEDAFNFNQNNYSCGQSSPDYKLKVWFHQTFEEYYKNKDIKLCMK